jgi:hypothetical protein
MIQQGLGRQIRDLAPGRTEGDKDARHPAAAAVFRSVTVSPIRSDRATAPPAALHGGEIGRRVGLSHRQRIGPHKRVEQLGQPQPVDQVDGQRLGLVGADRGGRPRARSRSTAATTPG